MLKPILIGALLMMGGTGSSLAASVSKTYSYFSVGGSTLSEIERELDRRGPQIAATGKRHPGATTLEFTSKLTFARENGSCRIANADISVKASVKLPRWKRPNRADQGTRLIWDTLASDIKRHEESHIGIAKNHARQLEASLERLGQFPSCRAAQASAQAVSTRALAQHDADQARFDRIEGRNFEDRIITLLKYRLQRMEAANGK
ncbi:DUF922 domain-containing protein [Mesorhizobium sp. RP14(2022)]|uniref:DUF922 domain-containing protein n=1 Tax=Mesorhizobium liriopis TaxID=2953882 RepID=A0ABT1CB96_9HYPH|nr:DUF922 domain-containing protein [Mesorhizobium liriopis]MCO6052094.1 DUF922 domain-containing protein [Mesorhizobium liriopis]